MKTVDIGSVVTCPHCRFRVYAITRAGAAREVALHAQLKHKDAA